MTIHKHTYIAILAMTAALLCSCSSGKTVSSVGNTSMAEATFLPSTHLSLVRAYTPKSEYLTSKVKVTAGLGDKTMSTSGTLRMKKDDVIQLSLYDPILGAMEVGRIEFSTTRVLIIARINRRYIDVPYTDVDFLKAADVDFNALQSVFWNQVFAAGKNSCNESDFTFTEDGDNIILTHTDDMLIYTFSTVRSSGQLSKTTITGATDRESALSCTYTDFTDFTDTMFPKDINLGFESSAKEKVTLHITLSNPKNSSDWDTHTTPPAKYTKAEPGKILKSLIK